ncbi:MAG TPA: class I SAM-dependent methyltransferase [Thermoplasmata archaeon]|nr:class I SAM-dependent methyltransferase [Thermoplasmata archaeon]
MATRPPATPEVIADYTEFDFESLWRGREKVTRIEEFLLRSALGPKPRARVLEIGTGFGRLTPTLLALSEEYVGVDFDPTGLGRARARLPPGHASSTRWALANLHHLPFLPGSFSAVVMVRVAHHVPCWAETARRLAALLRPGGRCVVTVNPSPTIGTVAEDVKRALHGEPALRWSTWAHGEDVQVSESPHPIYVGSRRGYRRSLEQAGFQISRELGSGLEELVPGVPVRGWVGLAPTAERLPWFPTKWYAADLPGRTEEPLPPIDSIFACPRCGTALPLGSLPAGEQDPCRQCGFQVRSVAGFPDLRYVTNGGRRIGPVAIRR